MHDGGVVIAQLAGVSEPPAVRRILTNKRQVLSPNERPVSPVAVAVVRAVGVAAVITLGQTGRAPDPGILVKLGRAGVLLECC